MIRTNLIVAGLCVALVAARAADAADAAAGAELARDWCSGCHVVAPDQERAAQDGVPSFAALADDPALDRDRLSAFLTAPHPPMPDLSLSRSQIADLVAYIESLGGARR